MVQWKVCKLLTRELRPELKRIVYVSQPLNAGARCGPAHANGRFHLEGGGRSEHVSAHGACRIDRIVRARKAKLKHWRGFETIVLQEPLQCLCFLSAQGNSGRA